MQWWEQIQSAFECLANWDSSVMLRNLDFARRLELPVEGF